jgi:hypothetical protein
VTAATLTAPAASAARTETGAESGWEAGAAETRAAETGAVREAGQTLRREGRACVLGEFAGAEASWAAVAVVLAVSVAAPLATP